jgi:hypothetical protein
MFPLLSRLTKMEFSVPWFSSGLSCSVKASALDVTVCEPGLLQNVAAAVKVLPVLLVVDVNAASAAPVVAATPSALAASASAHRRREVLTGSALPR